MDRENSKSKRFRCEFSHFSGKATAGRSLRSSSSIFRKVFRFFRWNSRLVHAQVPRTEAGKWLKKSDLGSALLEGRWMSSGSQTVRGFRWRFCVECRSLGSCENLGFVWICMCVYDFFFQCVCFEVRVWIRYVSIEYF